MTDATTIIQAAYREGNLIPVGKQPTSDEVAEALPRLNKYVQGVFGYEMGENLRDWLFPGKQRTAPVQANYPQFPLTKGSLASAQPQYPPTNSRIIFGSVSGTLYFPENPDDGARMAVAQGSGAGDSGTVGAMLTLDGNGRTIEGADTLVLTAPVAARQWLYRADLADWIVVQDMLATDQMPFPSELDDLWICTLAIRLAPRYGKTTAPETAKCAGTMMAKLKARYRQAAVTTYGSGNFPDTSQSFMNGYWDW